MRNLSPEYTNEVLIINKEAQIISNYLINASVGEKEEKLYIRAVIEKKIFLNTSDERLWRLMMKNKLFLSLVDAGLALLSPNCPIRERICIMLAILETHPSFINAFFIEKSKIKESIQLVWAMALSPVKAAIGILIIKLY